MENGTNDSINLDDIINFVLDKADNQIEACDLDFVKDSEQLLMTAIKAFALDVRKIDISDLDRRQMEDKIESISASLFDQIIEINTIYLKHGMKIGARFLAELVF